jgi:putative flippase GtrA
VPPTRPPPTGAFASLRQFGRYCGVGVAAAVAHYGTLIAAVELGALQPVAGALLGFVAGGIVSYGLNRRFTFRSRRAHAAAAPRFALIAATGFLLTGLLMAQLTGPLRLHYLAAQLVTTLVVLLWTFLANRAWTFRAPTLPSC